MAENIKATFYEVPRRPLNRLPDSTAVVSPRFPDIPRGSVKDRVNFFEQMRPQSSEPVPTRRFTTDSVFSSNKLNKRVDLDDPQVLPVPRKMKEETVFGKAIEVGEKPEVAKPAMDTPMTPRDEITPIVILPSPAPASSSPPQATKELTFFEHSYVPDLNLKVKEGHQRHSSLGASTAEPRGESLTPATNREGDIDAICVNCLEYVNLADIDDHSFMCSQVVYNPTSPQEEFSLKIKKLHRGINRRIKAAKGEKLMMLIRLREITVEVTKNEHINLPGVSMELDDLAATSLSIEGGIGCSIFARRLSNLVSEKETEINLGELTTENLLVHYNEEADKQRKELLRWKAQSQVLEQMAQAQRGLDEIKSDIGSDIGSANSYGNRSSGPSLGNEESDIADLEAANEALQQVSEEQLKKYFYSMCLKQKLLLPKTHPSQKILVSSLFQECRRQGVPVAQWEGFISANLVK